MYDLGLIILISFTSYWRINNERVTRYFLRNSIYISININYYWKISLIKHTYDKKLKSLNWIRMKSLYWLYTNYSNDRSINKIESFAAFKFSTIQTFRDCINYTIIDERDLMTSSQPNRVYHVYFYCIDL